jgi:hypothetical protein
MKIILNVRQNLRESLSAAILCASVTLTASIAWAEGPLHIARQGSMEAGGTTILCETNDGGDPNSTRWPRPCDGR